MCFHFTGVQDEFNPVEGPFHFDRQPWRSLRNVSVGNKANAHSGDLFGPGLVMV